MDGTSFKKLYTAFVRPHLEYAQSVWSQHLRKHIIENVQIRATKLVDGLARLDYPDRLKILILPTLAYRRLRSDLIEIYKHFDHYDIETISTTFQPRERVTRKHAFQLLERNAKDGSRGIQSNSFYYRPTRAWNNLPKTVVDTKSINSFKNRLDKHTSKDRVMFDHTINIERIEA